MAMERLETERAEAARAEAARAALADQIAKRQVEVDTAMDDVMEAVRDAFAAAKLASEAESRKVDDVVEASEAAQVRQSISK